MPETPRKRVPLTVNFDKSKVIGYAEVNMETGEIVGHISAQTETGDKIIKHVLHALFPTNYFREKAGMPDAENPFELELMETLRALDAFDKRLDPMKTWNPEIYKERNHLIWHAFDIARELDMDVSIAPEPSTPDGIQISIVLPLSDDNYPVTWIVAAGPVWGQTKEEKSRRINEYTKDLP